MKSKKRIFIYALFAGLFSAFVITGCSSDNSVIEQSNNEELTEIFGVKVELKNNTLALNSESDLEELVSKLRNNQSVSTRLSVEGYYTSSVDERLYIDGFASIYDVFADAMMSAESYYDREGGYEEFKEKYNTLYFPEHGDDFSAYLPVSDPYLAKLLNKDGEVIISGETVNMKNISTYEQLKELGLTMPEEEVVISDVENFATTRSLNYVTKYYFTGTPVELTIGTSTVKGERKVGVVLKNVYNTINGFEAGYDVVFRKRGFLNAWYNYRAITKTYFSYYKNYTLVGGPSNATLNYNYSKDATSSHDYRFKIQDEMFINNSDNFNKYMYGQIQIYYDGLKDYNFIVPLAFYTYTSK